MSFNDKKGQDTQPNKQHPTFGTQMGKNSPNANIDRKGTFKGTQKKVQHTLTKKKTSKTAPSNNFGKATQIASGKMNFSKGAPGHERGVIK